MNLKILLAAAVMSMALSAPVLAEEAAGPQTFGIVNLNDVFQTSEAGKAVFAELQKKEKDLQSQISKEENALREATQEFEKKKASMDKAELEKKHKAIEERFIKGQKMVQDSKALMNHAYTGAVGKLKSETADIVSDLMKERNLSAVLSPEAVMLSRPEMNLTAEVIKRLNDKVKKVDVDWSMPKKKAG